MTPRPPAQSLFTILQDLVTDNFLNRGLVAEYSVKRVALPDQANKRVQCTELSMKLGGNGIPDVSCSISNDGRVVLVSSQEQRRKIYMGLDKVLIAANLFFMGSIAKKLDEYGYERVQEERLKDSTSDHMVDVYVKNL